MSRVSRARPQLHPESLTADHRSRKRERGTTTQDSKLKGAREGGGEEVHNIHVTHSLGGKLG